MLLPWQIVLFELIIEETCVIISIKKQEDYQTRFRMTFNELIWFAAQINMQRWRFFYGRMSIQSRLKQLRVVAPAGKITDSDKSVAKKISELSHTITSIMYQ